MSPIFIGFRGKRVARADHRLTLMGGPVSISAGQNRSRGYTTCTRCSGSLRSDGIRKEMQNES